MSAEAWLLLETSQATSLVGLAIGGGAAAQVFEAPVGPARERLFPAMADLLAARHISASGITHVALGLGPGSFTGLRIGCTIARMLHMASGCRVVGVSSLEVIALETARREHTGAAAIGVCSLAQSGRIFAAMYEPGTKFGVCERTPVAIREPSEWLMSLPPGAVVSGPGLAKLHDMRTASHVRIATEACWRGSLDALLACAAGRVEAGEFLSMQQIVPNYVRGPECEEVYEERRAAARKRRGE